MDLCHFKTRNSKDRYKQLQKNSSTGISEGKYLESLAADMTADLLPKGTLSKTTAELEDAIKSLGSTISISAGPFGVYLTGNTLARNFKATIALAVEILLEPRWDAEEFETLKRRMLNDIDQRAANPNSILTREAAKLRYPEGHIFSYGFTGPKEKLEAVTLMT